MENEPNKGGRKSDGVERKPYQVYCTADDVVIARQLVKLSAEQKAYVKAWMDRGGIVKPKS